MPTGVNSSNLRAGKGQSRHVPGHVPEHVPERPRRMRAAVGPASSAHLCAAPHHLLLRRVVGIAGQSPRDGRPAHRTLRVVHTVVVRVPAGNGALGELEPTHLVSAEALSSSADVASAPRGSTIASVADLHIRRPSRRGPFNDWIRGDHPRLGNEVRNACRCDQPLEADAILAVLQQRAEHVERVPQPVPVGVARLIGVRPDPTVGLVCVREHVAHGLVNLCTHTGVDSAGGPRGLQ
eukprot:scaffold11739_cov129-Isochrysis_galbana.AAC.4